LSRLDPYFTEAVEVQPEGEPGDLAGRPGSGHGETCGALPRIRDMEGGMGPRLRLKRIPELLIAAGALLVVALLVTGLERLFPGPEIPADESPILGFPEDEPDPVLRERRDGTVVISFGHNVSRIQIEDENKRRDFVACVQNGLDAAALKKMEDDAEPEKEARARASRIERRERRRRFRELVDSCLQEALPLPAPPVADSEP